MLAVARRADARHSLVMVDDRGSAADPPLAPRGFRAIAHQGVHQRSFGEENSIAAMNNRSSGEDAGGPPGASGPSTGGEGPRPRPRRSAIQGRSRWQTGPHGGATEGREHETVMVRMRCLAADRVPPPFTLIPGRPYNLPLPGVERDIGPIASSSSRGRSSRSYDSTLRVRHRVLPSHV